MRGILARMRGMLKRIRHDEAARPLACVIGDIDLVRPLGLVGIRSVVVAAPTDPVRRSRMNAAFLPWTAGEADTRVLVERLLDVAAAQPLPLILFYEGDWDLLMVSRHRERLAERCRFVIPETQLVEDLVDKARFQKLARRLELPVPPSLRLSPARMSVTDVELGFPLIVKPLTRRGATWKPVAGDAKAVRVENAAELRALWPRLLESGVDVLAQQLIPGAETRIESYHAYIDERGETAGEFTGRKIRTLPPAYGFSTAVQITDEPDVRELGRRTLARVGLRGVAKVDFKRDDAGRLHLLEINPRFSLWHHAGARAGVNLPALVYADLAGLPRPHVAAARAGVRWCLHKHDARAARESGVSLVRWLPWALACEAKSAVAWDDPLPVLWGFVPWRFRGAGRPAPSDPRS
jgi:predicted ATP-grasp superfamily ATP-dependent carboligase